MSEENNQIPAELKRATREVIRDPDMWASLILTVGSIGGKALSTAEHIEFLISIREPSGRMVADRRYWGHMAHR
jgi:hypothetical protein